MPRLPVRRALIALLAVAALLAAPTRAAAAPNFVFVLTDDLSTDLLDYMPRVQAMQRQGTSFDSYIVTDSLCCPSRASIFTGRYPHSTGVITNGPPRGGFPVFTRVEEKSTFATSLQAAGYRTGLMGKYLNGYTVGRRFVPPGWSAWAVAGNGYANFNYGLLVKNPGGQPQVKRYGSKPNDYLTDVISRRGQQFIAGAVRARAPFMLELSTFAPHEPYTPAPRDADRFPGLKAPRGPLFNAPQLEAPPDWLSPAPLRPFEITAIDRNFRMRAQSVQAIDRMIGDIRTQLRELGAADNTYIVFSSDNGFHMGQRRLQQGKQTFWDEDIRVPLVIVGPGVPRGVTVEQLTANVDLRPTFQELAGVPVEPHVEGRSLAPFLRGQEVGPWRLATLIEHFGPSIDTADPDAQAQREGNPPSYAALRLDAALFVAYDDARHPPEYYADPFQQHNSYPTLEQPRRMRLGELLARLRYCSDGASCRAADAGS